MNNRERVFIYLDTSNIFLEARRIAEERNGDADARNRVRIHLERMFRLAHAGREVGTALAVGSVPPDMRHVWNRSDNPGVEIKLFERGSIESGEDDTPDRELKLRMLADAVDHIDDPGIVVLLTGNGNGYYQGSPGFDGTLERMHRLGWRVEVLSWRHACNRSMREWVEANGVFVALDDFYDSVTFMERSRPELDFMLGHKAADLDLAARPMAHT